MYISYDPNPVPVTYTAEELWKKIDEFIKVVNTEFSFKGVCQYIVDCAIKEGKVRDPEHTQYSSRELNPLSSIEVSKYLWELIWAKHIYIAFGDNPYAAQYNGDTRFVINEK